MNNLTKSFAVILAATTLSQADTTQTGPNTYEVDAGVTFQIANLGATSWLFSWTDSSGTYSNIPDPTITLTGGETYIFDTAVFDHPFAITDDTLPVDGVDGDFFRTTFDAGVIDAAILSPTADFTDSPMPAVDSITWTPNNMDAGEYFYTCLITFHMGMTGKLIVVEGAEICPADFTGDGMLDFFDVSAFLAAFTAGDISADMNYDGVINFFDVSAFLAAFVAGCP